MNRNASYPNNVLMKKAEWDAIAKSWEAIEKVAAEADAKCAADPKYEPSIIELKAKMRIVERAFGLPPPPPPPIPSKDHLFLLGELAAALLKAQEALNNIAIERKLFASSKDKGDAHAILDEIGKNPSLSNERLKELAKEYQAQLSELRKANDEFPVAMKAEQDLGVGP